MIKSKLGLFQKQIKHAGRYTIKSGQPSGRIALLKALAPPLSDSGCLWLMQSRTAKNQKDFKVQAMDGWKHGKPYAMVVCPIYQLPTRSSQIYQQASTRNVCIFTYSHLSLLVNCALEEGNGNAEGLLHEIFKTIPALNPSKNAVGYWLAVNKTILGYSKVIEGLWKTEKEAATESTEIVKEEGLSYLASEREKIMRMSHDEALNELIKMSKIESKIKTIKSISDSGLFGTK